MYLSFKPFRTSLFYIIDIRLVAWLLILSYHSNYCCTPRWGEDSGLQDELTYEIEIEMRSGVLPYPTSSFFSRLPVVSLGGDNRGESHYRFHQRLRYCCIQGFIKTRGKTSGVYSQCVEGEWRKYRHTKGGFVEYHQERVKEVRRGEDDNYLLKRASLPLDELKHGALYPLFLQSYESL